ncbi:MAG: 4-alpha-glucanotransferase [Candidatus Melainabacteria bacterium]|nr:4-alpha-glucanotransferase [Candidatus Melainabacteria bacterium]
MSKNTKFRVQQINLDKKLAGLLIPVFAMRSDEKDFGIGDTACVMQALDFLASLNMSVLQLLPINETGADNSPYNALSANALDPVYLTMTPEMVPGLSPAMLHELAPDSVLEPLRQGAVNYEPVKKLKLALLRAAYQAYKKKPVEPEELAAFKKERAWLEGYSLFRAFMDENGGSAVWTEWRSEHRSAEKCRALAEAPAISERRRFYEWVQWVAYRQWRQVRAYADKLNLELMGDIPFGVSRYSADVFCQPQFFDLESSGGAPPETFFQGDKFTEVWGQNWGIPLYDWQTLKKHDYSFWRQRVRSTAEIFHYFRIDHVLGFFRVYAFPWIPERNGEFVDLTLAQAKLKTGGRLPGFSPRSDEEPEDAAANCEDGTVLLSMILDAAGDTKVVAEDLGMVPDYVRPRLQEMGIPGFIIPIFERDEDDPERNFRKPETYEPLSLATLGTHDHQPLKTYYEELSKWWHGPDGHEGWLEVSRLMRFLGLEPEEAPEHFDSALQKRIFKVLFSSPSWLTVLMISDLFASAKRFNEPGLAEDSNWSQRLSKPFAAYRQDEKGEILSYVADLVVSSGRGRRTEGICLSRTNPD